jgi:hypothetical protein
MKSNNNQYYIICLLFTFNFKNSRQKIISSSTYKKYTDYQNKSSLLTFSNINKYYLILMMNLNYNLLFLIKKRKKIFYY